MTLEYAQIEHTTSTKNYCTRVTERGRHTVGEEHDRAVCSVQDGWLRTGQWPFGGAVYARCVAMMVIRLSPWLACVSGRTCAGTWSAASRII
jgi:hypothetical protein